MNRRQFGKSALAASVGASATAMSQAESKQKYYELRTYELRSDMDNSRLHKFMEKTLLPHLKKMSGGPVGCFNVVTGQFSPALIVLTQCDSLEQIFINTDQAEGEGEFAKVWKEFEEEKLPYVRYHSALLKAFASHTQIEVPKPLEKGRLFELRTYESKNGIKSASKINMFNSGEIQIFRDCKMAPIFFGEGLYGSRLPYLTYMVGHADMDARGKSWGEFGSHPDWNRMKNDPKWADTVSVIHASFLSPTDYSEIR